MLVRLYMPIAGVGAAGEDVEVSQEVGNRLNCQAECVILRHTDAVVPSTPRKEETNGTDKRTNPRSG